jgi:hypothetical protein
VLFTSELVHVLGIWGTSLENLYLSAGFCLWFD